MNRYTGQTVLVTGAGQGLGRAMAHRFAAEGAHVLIGEINEDAGAELATELTGKHGVLAQSRALDVTRSAEVDDWIRQIHAEHGSIDVLVNNAGIIRDNRVEDITDEDWRVVLDVSLGGSFHCARAVFPGMKERGYGRIVSFSSMSWRGNFGQANYVAAKAGIVGLTRTLALEGARHGITANAIAPGLIETPMLASMNGSARDKLTAKIPMRHTGRPADIAEAAAFLASKAAGYLTGVVLDVDGGLSIGSSIR
ncbi:SDR family NAD(P)-dependent oxidoreductase [Amycolatopsis magusensis]|uniref:3-oxoacyl-[acyl-carrier protein] reductase n=1 Tax=Amycolatopsis magusensis TaxID=882444 RepID=A0ABS4PZT0_9PSEU|nr:SDR family NAD(P)-dependent oxidoreductase [Amycolatopsis magusensis]MBP2184358.1 3-oxoacyl-[acyl-carrier protein] reductase [Amycolatopsis magusensis]